jgi:preprotein translocase subunit SecG
MQTVLNIFQIIISVLLILAVLLQVKGGGLGGIFGQSESIFRTKRGLEKWLFIGTVILVAFFIIISIASLMIS